MKLNLPKLIFADDYHDFGAFQMMLKGLFGKKHPKVSEINGLSYNGQYVAIVYEGKKPTKKVLNKILSENKVEIE